MKTMIVFAVVLVALVAADTYSTSHDGLDVEAIVTNKDTLQAFTNCFLDKGDCNETSSAFKATLPEATKEACAKCTKTQKHMLKRYLEEVKKNFPEDFKALNQKYDPEGKYVEALKAALADA